MKHCNKLIYCAYAIVDQRLCEWYFQTISCIRNKICLLICFFKAYCFRFIRYLLNLQTSNACLLTFIFIEFYLHTMLSPHTQFECNCGRCIHNTNAASAKVYIGSPGTFVPFQTELHKVREHYCSCHSPLDFSGTVDLKLHHHQYLTSCNSKHNLQ